MSVSIVPSVNYAAQNKLGFKKKRLLKFIFLQHIPYPLLEAKTWCRRLDTRIATAGSLTWHSSWEKNNCAVNIFQAIIRKWGYFAHFLMHFSPIHPGHLLDLDLKMFFHESSLFGWMSWIVYQRMYSLP